MRPLLQEAQFACFEDDEGDASLLPSFVVSSPSVRSPPPKSFARVRALECSGSGSFYFQNESLRDRFVCWRVLKNVVLLREWSLNKTLKHNGLRLEFPAPVLTTGVFVVESWEDDAVTVNVVTHAGTVHRFTYAVPSDDSLSVFSQADVKAFPEPKPAARTRCDVLQSLNTDEILTVALWVNEYNLVLGTDAGRVLGVNFGLPSDAKKLQEFIFSDESVVSWIWHGLIKTTAAKFKGSAEDAERRNVGAAVVAMTCFQIDGDDDEEAGENDVCIVTVSADCVLRAWSFSSQSCLGRQQLRSLVTPQSNEDEGRDEAGWEDEDLDGDDGLSSIGVYATHAKVVALSPTESDNCRLLVHLDTTAAHSSEIYLLRGDVQPSAASGTGAGGEDLALDTARVFTVQSLEQKRGLKMVDFAVDKNFLFSSWRSLDGDEVYIHPNPMALTGPKRIQGQLVSSLDVQMQKYETEDSEWLFDLKEEGVMSRIDDFFAERILLPGRFSRQNLANAIVEAQTGALGGITTQSPFTHRQPKYKNILVRLVSSRCVDAAGAAAVRSGTTPSVLRIRVWKELIALCTKHWRCESVPIGFATTTNALLPGAPVMLRRNRVSLLFPSAPSITAAFVPQVERGSTSGECVADLVLEVLPVFDAFPSHSFQSFIHREVADVASDWKVESFVALARHCVRLGLKPDFAASAPATGQTISAELVLTRSILRLSKLLGGDAAFQNQVFHDLVEHLFPFELWRGSGAYESLSPKRGSGPSSDEDEDMGNSKEDFVMADAAASADYYSTTRRAFFAGHEMCFAFDQVVSRTIDEMCNQSLRVVLFLAYLVDTRPAFLSSSTLSKIVRVYLPKSITVYQRWRLSRWVASQGITQPITDSDPAITSSATLMSPLLQMFLLDVNRKLNRSDSFKRALSMLQLASASNNVRSEEAHGVLATFTREILQYVSQPNDALVRFLQKRQQFRLLRAMFCCNLSDISLHGVGKGEGTSSLQSEQVNQYVRSIGECLACEGQEAAARAHDDEEARAHARWCFQQAIRCFSICLSNFFVESNHRSSLSEKALDQLIYEIVGLLKDTVPRGFYDQLLSFLWTVVTQALSHLTHHDGGEQSFALQSFIWVNVFKYSVEERLFRDAHLALMHTAELSATLGGSETAADAEGTASECVNYLVKELYRYGHLDLICELQWGSLESHVEKYILWQAANATIVQGEGLDASAVRYYNLLFTFYMRKQQPANATSSLYALALRLRLAVSTSKTALETQRNALNAACNALRALPVENRWIVRKLHTEELTRPSQDASERTSSTPSLSVVTLEDMRRELAVLDGKLRLLALGHTESVLLSTMDADEVTALLVDAVHNSCRNTGSTTLAERRRAGVLSIEMAADIASRGPVTSLSNLTKSLARYCVASEHPAVSSSISRSDGDLLWELLEMLLNNAASLEQYEVAAETVLDFWQQQGRKLALPEWLNERLSDPKSGNPAKLLILYVKHGLLLEALQLVEGLLPDAATMRGGNTKSAFSFQSQMEPNAGPPELPWIPYNLVDALLDSTSAVLEQGVSGDVSTAAIARLRERDHSLRQKLLRYFQTVNALQQAQEAASLARNSIDLDL